MSSIFHPTRRCQWRSVCLWAFVLIAALLLVGCDDSRVEAHRLYEKGYRNSHFQKKDPVRAEPLFLKALEIDPTLTQAHVELAEVYRVMGLLEKREHQLREVLRKAPDHVEAHYQLGVIAYEGGDFDLALREFETTHRLLKWPFGWEPGRNWYNLFIYQGFLLSQRGDVHLAEA
ncbi:tetratricopeptide repeat protein, partial [Nitrospinae bacterium AH-259-F20]|nr:tetratricopeptide repeat protein [Nitrospinae bacterium AH-259-F20]